MKNAHQDGRVLDVTLAADIKSGELVVQGKLVAVAVTDGKVGEIIATHVEGVFELPKLPAFKARRCLASYAVGPQGQRIELSLLHQQPLCAIAGIARPAVFFEMLRELGLDLLREIPLPDHADAEVYSALVHDPSHTLICTEKDAVKLFPLLAALPQGSAVQAWSVPLELTPEPAFFDAIDQCLARGSSQP